MDEGLRLQAQEWFDRGSHDIETAQLLYEQGGYTDMIAYHIQQVIEKYLYPPFIELCEKATRYYLEDRYPPGPSAEYHRDEIKKEMELAWKLIGEIRRQAGL